MVKYIIKTIYEKIHLKHTENKYIWLSRSKIYLEKETWSLKRQPPDRPVGCVLCKFRLLLLGPILQVFLYISTSLTSMWQNIPMFNRKYIFNPGPFSIAMLVYQSISSNRTQTDLFFWGVDHPFYGSTLPKYGSFGLKALIMCRFIGYLFPDRWAPIDWRKKF